MTRIRPATTADLDALHALEHQAFGPAAWSRRSIADELAADAGGCTLVAVTAADAPAAGHTKIVGYAVASYALDVADVRRIATSPTARRRGVGRALLTGLLEEAARRGCQRVLLEVAADNAAALALYRRQGFTGLDRRPRYYPGDVDALVLQLILAERPHGALRPSGGDGCGAGGRRARGTLGRDG